MCFGCAQFNFEQYYIVFLLNAKKGKLLFNHLIVINKVLESKI